MPMKSLVDPELVSLAETFPVFELSDSTIHQVREMTVGLTSLASPSDYGVHRREVFVESQTDAPTIRCLIYSRASNSGSVAPAFLQIHGGGLVLGSAEGSDVRNIRTAAELGVIVVAVEYRLSPEHAYPAPLDDCHTVLAWMFDNAQELGIDPTKIAIGGESAGGGLAAGLALRVRDEGKLAVCFQHLVYPMLDDRTTLPDSPHDPNLGNYIWTRSQNQFGWASYLSGCEPAEPAVPARATSLANLPPAWIGVGALDLFLDENIVYARRLMEVGVTTELQIYPAAFHGFPFAEEAAVSKRFELDYLSSLARGLGIKSGLGLTK